MSKYLKVRWNTFHFPDFTDIPVKWCGRPGRVRLLRVHHQCKAALGELAWGPWATLLVFHCLLCAHGEGLGTHMWTTHLPRGPPKRHPYPVKQLLLVSSYSGLCTLGVCSTHRKLDLGKRSMQALEVGSGPFGQEIWGLSSWVWSTNWVGEKVSRMAHPLGLIGSSNCGRYKWRRRRSTVGPTVGPGPWSVLLFAWRTPGLRSWLVRGFQGLFWPHYI